MATNDYRSYIRAMEEYRHSDTLQHAGKKGMKWGISHTPGYKAVGEKAKGILNAAGQYIYDTAKKVGNAATTTYNKVTKTFNSAVKKPTVQTYNNSTKTFENNVQTWDSVDKKLANKASDARNEAFNERSERLKQDQVKKIADEYKNKFTKLYNPLDKPAPKLEATPNPEPRTIKEPEKPSEPEQVVEEPADELDARTKEALKKVGISEEDWKNMSQQERDQATSDISFQRALDEIDEDNGNSEDEPGVKRPSDRMTDDDGNLKLIDKYGPYFYVNGENHYDIEGKEYFYSDGLYFPIDGSGEALALKWNEEKFHFEPAEDFRHDDTSPRYIGEILDAEDGDFLEHYGILGMKWGIRRYQNEDGTLTPEGRERYARNAIEYDKKEGKLYKKVKNNKDIKAFNKQYVKDHPELKKAIEDADEYSKARMEYLSATFMQPGNRFILDLPPEEQAFYVNMALDIWMSTSPDAKKFEGLDDRYNNAMRDYEKAAHKYVDDLLGEYKELASENPNRISVDIETGKSTATSIGDELVVEMIRSMDKKAWKGRIDHSDIDSDQNELYHEGRGHLDGGHSGRYPWGSGEDPYQSDPVAKAGYNEAKNFINKYGVIDVATVYNNNNPSPYANATDRRKKRFGLIGDTAMAVGSLQQEPDKAKEIADRYSKAIKDSGTRGWSVRDFEDIPTEQILESNKRQNAIEQWKKLNGETTPVEAGKAKAADIVKAIGTAFVAVKLLEKATGDK